MYDEVSQLDKAVEDYTRAIKLVPGDEAFFYSRGHAYFRLNKDELAIADLTAAIKLQPNLAELYFWRGFSFERTKKYIEAKQDFSRVIAAENDPAVLGEVRASIVGLPPLKGIALFISPTSTWHLS